MYVDKFRLDGKIAVITGASRGIGKEIALGFAEQGARLVIASRKQESVDVAAEEIRRRGAECTALVCHMGNPDQIRSLFERTVQTYGTVDVLVNNAAINPFFGPVLQADEGIWDKTVGVNLKGCFLASQTAARIMVDKGGGAIVNIASVAAHSPPPGQGIYAITKAGLVAMTKSFAKELALSGVRVNAVCPGLTETRFSQMLIDSKEIHDIAMQMVPMKRHAQPSEMVCAALYLASEASAYVTGTCINVDGGQMS
jgi:NAD(P)-dependent dehydrogenase (short-subunit alcohol dehydrogenase family)